VNTNDRFRTLVAGVGIILIGSGLGDALANVLPYIDPGTLFLAGAPLLTATIFKKGEK
jgi:hypothetical protein